MIKSWGRNRSFIGLTSWPVEEEEEEEDTTREVPEDESEFTGTLWVPQGR